MCTHPRIRSYITMTSLWPRWRLKSPASRLCTRPFIQTQIKENIKAPRHWTLCGEFTGTGEFPAQRVSYAENVSIWWRHHEMTTGSTINCVVQSRCPSYDMNLTHWGLNKMATILQTTFTNEFSCIKFIVIGLIFHWKSQYFNWR